MELAKKIKNKKLRGNGENFCMCFSVLFWRISFLRLSMAFIEFNSKATTRLTVSPKGKY